LVFEETIFYTIQRTLVNHQHQFRHPIDSLSAGFNEQSLTLTALDSQGFKGRRVKLIKAYPRKTWCRNQFAIP
jgi:hypothetical protein